jgi:hypothetical protein
MNVLRKATGSLGFILSAAALASASLGTAGGVRWSVPARWTEQPARSMRVATYTIPGKKAADSAECAVFHFGRGNGGGVEENITRWAQQFEASPKPKTSVAKVRGMAVHRVDISGTYLTPGGPMMQSQGAKPGYRLLGAIVEAPGGLVFFKCVGPAATISAAEKEIETLIASIEKAGSSF